MPPTDFATHTDDVALFRYGLIADLRDARPGDRSLHVRLEEKADREYDIPRSTCLRVAAGTLRESLYAHRRVGFDPLKPRPRQGVGRARALPPPLSSLPLMLQGPSRRRFVGSLSLFRIPPSEEPLDGPPFVGCEPQRHGSGTGRAPVAHEVQVVG